MTSGSWNTISTHSDVMQLAQDLGEHFKEKIIDTDGNVARFISVNTFDYVPDSYRDYAVLDLTVTYSSDQGSLQPRVIVKQFRTPELFQREFTRYVNLEGNCAQFSSLSVMPLIHYDEKKNYVVYEMVNGYTLDQLSLTSEIYHYLLGRILGVIHGKSTQPVEDSTIREYIIFLLMHMPFTPEEKEGLMQFIEPQFEKFTDNLGRYEANCKFSTENVLIIPKQENITLETIVQEEALDIYIGMEEPENITGDRMADIAQIYHSWVYQEFLTTNTIEQTKHLVYNFFSGYLGVMNQIEAISLIDMYPNGISLDLHLVATAWMEEVEKVRTSTDPDNFGDRQSLLYSVLLLGDEPFLDLIAYS